jgi:Citrate transporter
MTALLLGWLPLSVLFMIACALALAINYPTLKDQRDRIEHHAGNVLSVVSVILAAGILTGILSGTKMVDAMANSVVALVPDAFGPYLAIITSILSLPFTFFISNDAFYYGVVPILSQAAGPTASALHIEVDHRHSVHPADDRSPHGDHSARRGNAVIAPRGEAHQTSVPSPRPTGFTPSMQQLAPLR